jgi:hypothetical protein
MKFIFCLAPSKILVVAAGVDNRRERDTTGRQPFFIRVWSTRGVELVFSAFVGFFRVPVLGRHEKGRSFRKITQKNKLYA